MTDITDRFKDIRPLYDSEVPETVARLVADRGFRRAVEPIMKPLLSWEQFSEIVTRCKSKNDFQARIIHPLLKRLIKQTTTKMVGAGWENVEKGNSYLFISNHRDIVLDAAFFNILLFDKQFQTTEIAIGDNLLIHPWITDLVRINKSFIVKRNVSVREMLKVSRQLSDYIHHTINQRAQSIWIAQREGRAKDSDDKTQASLLKMFTLHDSAKPLEMLRQLRIVPLSISYEYDPCDFLKAKEFQLKRDTADHKKSEADDIENMATGIMGFKGQVVFRLGECINRGLEAIPAGASRNEVLDRAATLIDHEIYRNYSFFPINYIAYDRMSGSNRFRNEYSDEEVAHFDTYLQRQVDKIDIPNKDSDFLRDIIINMYGNTVKNHLEQGGEKEC
jgi:hypothetical protein